MISIEHAKGTIDVLSLSTIFLALLDKMPGIAALAAFVWTLIRIYETDTCKRFIRWIRRRK